MNQSEYEVVTCSWHKARENARVQVAIGIGFASHWLKKWREFCSPIQNQSKTQFTFQLCEVPGVHVLTPHVETRLDARVSTHAGDGKLRNHTYYFQT